jgi:hypothetical protein
VNVWVAGIICLIALVAFVILFRRRTAVPARPATPQPATPAAAAATGHVPTERPTAAIEARRKSQRKRKPT